MTRVAVPKRLTAALPSTSDKVDRLTSLFARELGLVGATAGGVAAAPFLGTASSVAAAVAESGTSRAARCRQVRRIEFVLVTRHLNAPSDTKPVPRIATIRGEDLRTWYRPCVRALVDGQGVSVERLQRVPWEVMAMKLEELITNTREALTVQHVFGAPYERDGVTIIPAAVVRGGAGGGEGEDGEAGRGQGGGFGLSERPIGVYRVVGDDVRWVPAIDTTRVILMGQVVVLAALLVARALVRR